MQNTQHISLFVNGTVTSVELQPDGFTAQRSPDPIVRYEDWLAGNWKPSRGGLRFSITLGRDQDGRLWIRKSVSREDDHFPSPFDIIELEALYVVHPHVCDIYFSEDPIAGVETYSLYSCLDDNDVIIEAKPDLKSVLLSDADAVIWWEGLPHFGIPKEVA